MPGLRESRYSGSEKVFEQACRIIPGGVNSSFRSAEPRLVIRRAEGARLTDADGNEYIDYHAAFGPALLGHNHPAVRRRVAEALESRLLPGVGITELEIELARKIHQHLPSAERVLLCNSGSEATFHAIRVSRASTARKKIIKFQGCYHGFHDSVLCNLANPALKTGSTAAGSAGILPEVLENTVVCAFNDLAGVERALETHRGQIAAIIVEPIAHNMGCVMPRPGFLEGLRQLATAHGAALIFGKADLMDHFKTRPGGDTFYSGTFNGNAVGCAAVLATVELLEREPVHECVFRLGEKVRRGLRDIHERLGVRANVAGYGSVFLTYFLDGPLESYSDLLRNDAERFVEYRRRLIELGIFEMPSNLTRCHVSYSHTEADIDRTLEAVEHVLKQMVGAPSRHKAS
ncbi:MAG: aspartate aminotransferase family protein [Acidobacteria bacterium]|nr:MAG: aspartate aminotransferase family protein [Acidobacteriota bacterium]